MIFKLSFFLNSAGSSFGDKSLLTNFGRHFVFSLASFAKRAFSHEILHLKFKIHGKFTLGLAFSMKTKSSIMFRK